MPSYACRHPLCTAYIPHHGYCPLHAGHASRHAHYDVHQRNAAAKVFYASARWRRARAAKLAQDPVCERCHVVFADTVHHKIPLKDCTDTLQTAAANLMSLCAPCHNAVEAESDAH